MFIPQRYVLLYRVFLARATAPHIRFNYLSIASDREIALKASVYFFSRVPSSGSGSDPAHGHTVR